MTYQEKKSIVSVISAIFIPSFIKLTISSFPITTKIHRERLATP
ncbi:hypothetical protein P9D43_17810 [Neobacillus niacini]|nr:hypothetical protein [Neobacillus niacini]MEC1523858.1 hypothetical protein [Neobacillus niacini]